MVAPIVPPDPPLTDGTVRLRPWSTGDVDDVQRACQDPEIPRWTTVPSPYTRHDAEGFVELTRFAWTLGTAACFAIVDAVDGRLLGSIDLRAPDGGTVGMIGYWVAPWARGTGVATAALRLLSDWAHGPVGLEVTLLEIFAGNDASARVAGKAGYRQVGRVQSDTRQPPVDALLFSRLTPPTAMTEG